MIRNVMAGLLFAVAITTTQEAFARSGQDHVSFGERIVISQNETASDLVCFLCSIENHGEVHGDVVSFLGGLKSDGPIDGDAVSFGGDVNLQGEGSIRGSLVVMGGALHESENARTGKEQVIFPVTALVIPLLVLGGLVWGLKRLAGRPRFPQMPSARW